MIRKVFPFILLFILAIAYFLPVFLHPDKMLHGPDFINDYAWKSFVKNSIAAGELPIWNPYDRTGFPSFAHPSYGLWYPGNILFLIFPVNFAINLSIVVHVFLATVFSYLFARKIGLGVLPSLAVSVVFSFNGYLPARVFSGHRVIIESLAWIPVIFFFLQSYLTTEKRKYLILTGFSVCLQVLAGYPAVFVYTFEALVIYTILIPVKKLVFRVLTLAAVVGIGLLLSSIQLIPFLELTKYLTRSNFTYERGVVGSFMPEHFLTFVSPFAFGNPLNGTYTGSPNFWELSVYPGVLSLFLFPFSLALLRKKRISSMAFWGICLAMIFLGMGKANPFYHFIWDHVSFYQSTRVPARHMLIFAFSFSVLVGIGLGLVRKKILQGIFLVLLVIDLFWYGKDFIKLDDPKIYEGNEKVISYLKTDRSIFRLYQVYDIYSYMRNNVMDFNTPFMYGIYTIKAYDPFALRTYHDFVNKMEGTSQYGEYDVPIVGTTSPALDFLNAKYFLTMPGVALDQQDKSRYKKVISDPAYNLFENLKVEPRVYLDSDKDGKVKISKYGLNEVIFEVNVSKDTKLMSSELYYPGWKMKVDGRGEEFSLANNYFRGAAIQKGEHQVKWYFFPMSLLVGALISLGTIVGCFVYLIKWK